MPDKMSLEIHASPLQLKLIQLIFDCFCSSGNWPKSRELQVNFLPDDFWSVINTIDDRLLSRRGEIADPSSQTTLSIIGITFCNGSEKVLSLFIQVLQFCCDVYTKYPGEPEVKAQQLQQELSLTNEETKLALHLILIAHRTYTSASLPDNHVNIRIMLHPHILKYRNVRSISQYVEIANEDSRQKYRGIEVISFKQRVIERIKHYWVFFAAIVAAITVIMTFLDSLTKMPEYTKRFGDFISGKPNYADHYREFDSLLSIGEVVKAQFLLTGEIANLKQQQPRPPTLVLESLLIETYVGPAHWDSYSQSGRWELRNELRKYPNYDRNEEAQILLTYRLEDSIKPAAAYFTEKEVKLRSPFVRMLAAREVGVNNFYWTESTLREVVAKANQDCARALQVHALAWLSHLYRNHGDSIAAKIAIDSALQVLKNTKALKDVEYRPLRVRLHGERLLVHNKFAGHDETVEEEIVAIRQEMDEIGVAAVSLSDASAQVKGLFWIGLHFSVQQHWDSASYYFSRCNAAFLRSVFSNLRQEYPYIHAMSSVLEAKSRISLGELDATTKELLLKGLQNVRQLNTKGEYFGEESLCRLLLSMYSFRTANMRDGELNFIEAKKLRDIVMSNGKSFGYEREWWQALTIRTLMSKKNL